MATWVRSGTGTYPSGTNVDVLGTMELDNGTAPGDFDPTAVNSVRIQYDMEVVSGTFTSPEDHTVLRAVELTLNGVGTAIASVNGTDTDLDNGTTPISTDETDSSPGLGFTVGQWEGAELNPIDVATVRAWTNYNQDMGKDGVNIAVASSPNVTVTIDYTPDTGVNVDGAGIGHAVSQALTAHDVVVISDGIGHGSPSALTAHDVVVRSTQRGHAVSSALTAHDVLIPNTAVGHVASSGTAIGVAVVVGDFVDGAGAGHGVARSLTAHDVVAIGDGVGHATPSALAAADVVVVSSGVGHAVASGSSALGTIRTGSGVGHAVPSSLAESPQPFEVRLGDITDPEDDSNHELQVQMRVASGAGTMVVQLKQANTVIQEFSQALTTSFVEYGFDVTSASSITDYSNLRVRIWIESGNTGKPEVSRLRLCMPSIAVGAPPVVGTGIGHAVSSSTVVVDILIPAAAFGHAVPSGQSDSNVLIPAAGVGRSGVFGSSVGVPTRILTAVGRAASSGTAQADVVVNGTGVGHVAPSSQAIPGIIKVATAQGHATAQGISASDVLVIASAVGHGVPSGQAVGALGGFVTATASGHITARGASVTDMVVVATALDTAAPSGRAVSTSLIVGSGVGHAAPSSLSLAIVSQLITASAIGHATPQGTLTQPAVVVNATGSGQATPSAQAQLVRIVVGQALGQIVAAAGSDSNVLLNAIALGHAVSWGLADTPGETRLLTAIGHAAGYGNAVELTQIITGILNPPRTYEGDREMENGKRTLVDAGRSYSGDRTYDNGKRDGP